LSSVLHLISTETSTDVWNMREGETDKDKERRGDGVYLWEITPFMCTYLHVVTVVQKGRLVVSCVEVWDKASISGCVRERKRDLPLKKKRNK
jgi:hypothetical protein